MPLIEGHTTERVLRNADAYLTVLSAQPDSRGWLNQACYYDKRSHPPKREHKLEGYRAEYDPKYRIQLRVLWRWQCERWKDNRFLLTLRGARHRQ